MSWRRATRGDYNTVLRDNLRGAKIAMKRVRYMDWEVAADYLYAKMAEALHLGGAENRANAMKAFLDDKTFKPGVEHFHDTK
jgi:trans-feruloyl-CoA hydratase/vanillin synthase